MHSLSREPEDSWLSEPFCELDHRDPETIQLPLSAAAFLGWILVKSLDAAPAGQVWSVVTIVLVGLALMFVARFGLRSPFLPPVPGKRPPPPLIPTVP
jgi:hypothetical protein